MIFQKLIFSLYRLGKYAIISFFKKFIRIPGIFQDLYKPEDNTKVILFTDNDLLWIDYPLRHRLTSTSRDPLHIKVSLIASVKNELDNIDQWIERICSQTYQPSEIIIADGGSTDGTIDRLLNQQKKSSIPIHILSNDGGNIAQGRNMAISQSAYEIVAVTDFGCLPHINWLENILTPFTVDPEIVVSAGIYDLINPSGKSNSMKKLWLWGTPEKISPQNYLPPGGSVAFKKIVWKTIGGYPEWLTMTGEDTFFDLAVKQLGGKWAFVPEAIVQWYGPFNFFPYIKKLFYWAIGDGEMKLRGDHYLKVLIKYIFSTFVFILAILFPLIGYYFFRQKLIFILWFYLFVTFSLLTSLFVWSRHNNLPIFLFLHRYFAGIAQLFGFLTGSRRQAIINSKRYSSTSGVILLLSGVPIDDTGGGARCTQIAMELLEKNYVVIFINRFPKYESKKLNLAISHRNLIIRSLKDGSIKSFVKTIQGIHPTKNLIAIVEHPIRDFLPILKYINKIQGKTIYDKIDDWDSSLGGNWYSSDIERKFISQSQILTATAPILAESLSKLSNREVHILPNAVNPNLFNPDNSYSMPEDMPGGIWTGIYIGALWGDWFDWNLLIDIAENYPNATFPIIGDFKSLDRSFPSNIHFLGLKKQSDLPAYLKYSNVAFIPWKVNKITQATSPIKVYEFLSMRCPVVAPHLEILDGIPGLILAKNNADFVECLDKARNTPLNKINISTFIAANTWEIRVQKLIDLIN